jgi:hypothetical protein
VTLHVDWTPEATEDLLEARSWYDNIGLELGGRFAQAVEATVEAVQDARYSFQSFIEAFVVRESAAFPTASSLRFRRIAYWSSRVSTDDAIQGIGDHARTASFIPIPDSA